MKLTGPAYAEAISGAEEAERRERAKGNAGGVRVELRVRPHQSLSDGNLDAGGRVVDKQPGSIGESNAKFAFTMPPDFGYDLALKQFRCPFGLLL